MNLTHVPLLIACLLVASWTVKAEDLTLETLKTLSTQLREGDFKARRKADKAILQGMLALEKTFVESVLRNYDRNKRLVGDVLEEKAATTADAALGKKIKTLRTYLNGLMTKSGDPEVSERLKTILGKLHPTGLYDMDATMQRLVLASFRDPLLSKSDHEIHTPFYGHCSGAIMVFEFADVRLVRLGKKARATDGQITKVPIKLPDGTGRGAKDSNGFSFMATSSDTTVTWQGWTVTIRNGTIAIGQEKATIGAGRQVLVIDDKGTCLHRFNFGKAPIPAPPGDATKRDVIQALPADAVKTKPKK